MAKPEAIEEQLANWRIGNHDDFDSSQERLAAALSKLPKTLKGIGYNAFGFKEDGTDEDDGDELTADQLQAQKKRRLELLSQFDKLAADDRKKVFACVVPTLADAMEAAWQTLKSFPYKVGYSRRAFRAPKNSEVTLRTRINWLRSFARSTAGFKPEILTLPWLARWAQHAFSYSSDCVVPLLIGAMNPGGKQGDEVFDILYKTVTREDPIGVMGTHVIESLFGSSREAGWEIMEKTLLAAQRQEGLRQSIVQNADCAHPQAFVRLLRLIVDKDLIRFSSVARAVNLWLGLLWDSASTKVIAENVEAILKFIESSSERKQALASDNAETVFRALWASAFEDAPATIPLAAKLLKHDSDEIRFVASWILTLSGLDSADKSKLIALADANLQVALMAAVNVRGIEIDSEMHLTLGVDQEPGKEKFELLEKLYHRLPEKPQKLEAIVWPWTERKIERAMITENLLGALGDRPPTRMLPYLKALSTWDQQILISRLSAQKKWDSLTRTTLFELVGNPSPDVRQAAFVALEKQTLMQSEFDLLEGYLTRQAADLRKGVIGLISKCKDAEVLASADRLVAKGDRHQRFAGLEILRQMAEANRRRSDCQSRAENYRSRKNSLTKEEETQLAAIAASDRQVVSLNDALGLMNPLGRSKVVAPQKKKVVPITKAAIACLKSLDDLIHQHRATSIKLKSYRGEEDRLLGEVEPYLLPNVDLSKPMKSQKDPFPLLDVWESWRANRPASQRDKDGYELVRALMLVRTISDYKVDNLKKFVKTPENKAVALAVLGELDAPKFRYFRLMGSLLDWLAFTELPKGCTDFLLDCTENTYAHVPDQMLKKLTEEVPESKKRHYWEDDERDWRNLLVFEIWPLMLERFLRETEIKLSDAQRRRVWELARYHDEPCPGAPRMKLPWSTVAQAYQEKLATYDDLVDSLLGPGRSGYSEFGDLGELSARALPKAAKAIVDETQGLRELVDKIRQRVVEIELDRGEAATAATKPALALQSLFGMNTLFKVMSALNKGKLKIDRRWQDGAGESRNATLTHLLKICFPTDDDAQVEFERHVKEGVAAGYCSEDRLLELAFLAPQWTKFVGQTLGWDGFSEGLYWFLAHMSTSGNDSTDAAAGAEGLVDAEEDGDESEEYDEDESETESESIPKREKLSAWERLMIERTPVTPEERAEGAVDVAWFHRTWEGLGEKRWMQMAEAAKFAANSAQANKAQFLADVLLGKKSRKDLIDGIQKKKLKENVRLLGLLPLEKGTKREKDLLERYEILQDYKKYARGLSSLTKPAAMRAVEIGMNNLARLAGFPDPLRLEWALEAESIKDLAKGPVAVTKDGITVTLQLASDAKPQLSIQRGEKSLKSIPSATKKKHAAIAELADRSSELRKKAGRMKQSLEVAMCRGDVIEASELTRLFEHAILAPQLSKLVFVGDGIMGYPDKGGRVLRDHAGKLEPIKKGEQLRLAHSHDLFSRGDWEKWQQECFRSERVQPFKQVFRELYVVTKQEKKDQTFSQRFAGHQIGPRQAMALWNSRGWNTQDEVVKIFHDLSLIAQVTFQVDYGTAAEVEGLTVEKVEFRKRDDYRPLKLAAVPASVFSEVMRDVDLVVSVAHRGAVDPEASASTVEMRTALIRETCQLLGLTNVRLKENHATIKGYYGEYSVHLGSGGVHRLPGGAVAILPVHAQHRGRLFLPFADDDPRSAEVISKVLLLARDEEIQDPTILDQLGAPVGKRQVLVTEDKPAKSPSRKRASSATEAPTSSVLTSGTNASSASGKRHFEFQEGSSNKFWEVELSGNSVTTTWGRKGTAGQSKTKEFADSAKAQAEYDKLIKEKTSKGYIESA